MTLTLESAAILNDGHCYRLVGEVKVDARRNRPNRMISTHPSLQVKPRVELADAFVTMLKARELCSAGRVKDAVAVYNGIAIAPVQAAAK